MLCTFLSTVCQYPLYKRKQAGFLYFAKLADFNPNKSGMSAANKGGACWRFFSNYCCTLPPIILAHAISWRKNSNWYKPPLWYYLYTKRPVLFIFLPFSKWKRSYASWCKFLLNRSWSFFSNATLIRVKNAYAVKGWILRAFKKYLHLQSQSHDYSICIMITKFYWLYLLLILVKVAILFGMIFFYLLRCLLSNLQFCSSLRNNYQLQQCQK